MRLWGTIVLMCGALGCAPASPDLGIPQGDGTARASFDAHSDGAEPFTVEVQFPADSTGKPSGAGLAAAVLLPAADVDPTHYRWLARELARAGFVVALPEMQHGEADLDPQRARVARDLLASDRGLLQGLVAADHIAVMGHGLGGAVAAQEAVGGPFQALVILAAVPRAGDAVESLALPSLMVEGTSDCATTQESARAGWLRLPSPSALVEISGATQTGFTDDDSADVTDCPPGIGLDDAHARISAAVAAFLDFALRGTPGALQQLQSPAAGVIVETR